MKKILCALCALFIITMCTGCGDSKVNNRSDVDGTRIGVLAGTTSERYGEMHGTVRACNSKQELITALQQGDIDCIVADIRDEAYIKRFKISLKTVNELLAESRFRVAAANENPDLIDDIDDAIYALTENGVLDDIIDGHYDDEDYEYVPGAVSEDAPTLTVAVGGVFPPYNVIDEDGVPSGIDVDVARAICSYLDLNIEIVVVKGTDLIKQVRSGVVHFALGGLTLNSITEGECILSDSYALCEQVIIVKR